jgi:threonine dehydrogenase-like Zn-dependent dehydrogenase
MNQSPKTMRAAVLSTPGKFELQSVDIPDPAATQVRVRMEGCGVCGSNLAPWEGRPWLTYPFEAGAPGHEGWGEVEAVGERVVKVRPRDRVAILSYHSFADYDVADENNVVILPQSLKKKPFPGEALGCAFNVFRRSEIKPGKTVAIIGIGFLGGLLTALASKAGAHVIAISRRAFALEIARTMGAHDVIECGADCIEKVKEITQDKLCDCVIEAAGAQESLDLAGELTMERGRLVIAGYHQDGSRKVNMQLWNWRGLDVINAHERDSLVYIQGINEAIQEVAAGRLDPTPLYTHAFAFEDIGDAFTAMKERPNNFLKALVRICA